MKIRVEVKLPHADPLVQFVDVDEETRPDARGYRYDREPHEKRRIVEQRIRTIQKRYPKATVTWREVEPVDAA